MLRRHISHEHEGTSWEDLGLGAATIIGLARLCANALAAEHCATDDLSLEAKAILYVARQRGVIEIKASNDAYDAVDRFLAVFVESDPDRGVVFKRKPDPKRTIRFLDAFRELCAAGLVFHQLYREFSLNTAGFRVADSVRLAEVEEALQFGVELSRHEW